MSDNFEGSIAPLPFAAYVGWSDPPASPDNYSGTAPPIGAFQQYTGWADVATTASIQNEILAFICDVGNLMNS